MKKLQRYTAEFRAEAIKLVFEQSLSLETAAKRLAIPAGTALTPAQVTSLSAGNFYVNVHTLAHPEGEIRGQIDGGPTTLLPKAVVKAGTITE